MAQVNKSSYHILISLIEIWTPRDKTKPMKRDENAVMRIAEVGEVEISESYSELIGKASVKFPLGTVIRKTKTLIKDSENSDIQIGVENNGIVAEVRTNTKMADVNTFSIGDRIRIYLGYTEDPKIANMAKTANAHDDNSIYRSSSSRQKYIKELGGEPMFEGYITQISADLPVEIECENMAHYLKEITCPKATIKGNDTVNKLFKKDYKGGLNLLKDTGIELYPVTSSQEYNLGTIPLTDDLVIADVLQEWQKCHINSFIRTVNNKVYLVIGRSYFSQTEKDSVCNLVENSGPFDIEFDYNVANNGLTAQRSDPKFLAVKAEGFEDVSSNKTIHFIIILNPDYDKNSTADKHKKWRIVNETTVTKKMLKKGVVSLTNSKDKVNMNLYDVISYMSKKVPVTRDQLFDEAIKYFESYNMNGIDGTLTLFGDLHLHTACQVHLIDNRYPNKNGYYLVEDVTTHFGTNGFRQTIKLPYCIRRDSDTDDNK